LFSNLNYDIYTLLELNKKLAYEAIPGTAGTKEIGLGFAFAGVCVLLPLLASAGIPAITSELRKRGLV